MLWDALDLAEEKRLSERFETSGVQDAFLFRNLSRARQIATYLIDDHGVLSQKKLETFLGKLQKEKLPEYPQGSFDQVARAHFTQTCLFLQKNKTALEILKRFTVPVANRYVEDLVLYSLNLPSGTQIGNGHLRRAVLSALLTPLRQNVGSCFATAPAILIQQEQPERLLIDLHDLMMTCTLKRTYGGEEYAVPIAMSWGVGDLRKPIHFGHEQVMESPSLQAALETAGIELGDYPKHTQTVESFLKEAIHTQYNLCSRKLEAHRKKRVLKKTLFTKGSDEVERILELEKEAKDRFKAFTDHALLKMWEYTLASFTDFKIEFFRWNLYASLGFDPKDEGGIAHLLYEKIGGNLEEANEKTKQFQVDYNRAVDEVNVTQTLLRQADSRDRVRLLKSELETRLMHARACKDLMDDSYKRATFFSNFFSLLLKQYSEKFQEYFQEVYDPEMFDIGASMYEDSPAGFRLVFKHGRKDPTLWTTITDAESYIWALTQFFNSTEPMIAAECEWKKAEKELQEVTTALVHHLQTEEFLSSALQRMARRHEAKSESEKQQKKPWSYTSGGTMPTLIKSYYCLEKELSEEKRVIESPQDLLIFLLDTMKALPYSVTKPFEDNPDLSMLMASPNHAFLFKPGLFPFKEGWLDKGFTYTWVRDHLTEPAQTAYEKIELDRDKQLELAERFFEVFYPKKAAFLIQQFIPHVSVLNLLNFRAHLLKAGPGNRDQIDAFLRSMYPQPGLLFADSNWGEFYFGFVVNPGTFELELWRLDTYGRLGFPMNSWKEWLDGSHDRPWILYTNPKEYSGGQLTDLSWVKA